MTLDNALRPLVTAFDAGALPEVGSVNSVGIRDLRFSNFACTKGAGGHPASSIVTIIESATLFKHSARSSSEVTFTAMLLNNLNLEDLNMWKYPESCDPAFMEAGLGATGVAISPSKNIADGGCGSLKKKTQCEN